MLGRFAVAATALVGVLVLSVPVVAQFQLPGARFKRPPATTPDAAPDGNVSADTKNEPTGPTPANPGKPVALQPPGEGTLAGRTLQHNGRRGLMQLGRAATGLIIKRLVLDGDVISKPGETCRIEVKGAPFTARFSGFDKGLRQYRVETQTCPFSFVVLDGSLIATHRKSSFSTGLGKGTCRFVARDCRGYLAGFWGPSGRSFNKRNDRAIEKARGSSERNARANFRALLRANSGDRKGIRAVAADQAGFSARREERCRDFLREHVHGYCASRITEARAIELGDRLNKTIARRNAEFKRKQAARRAQRKAKGKQHQRNRRR